MRIAPDVVREFASTGVLRAALNLANPVLARSKTSTDKPAGVTIDLSREFARQLGVEVAFLGFDTPGAAAAAIGSGEADIGFLAVDPQRAETIHFTQPYVEIEGCYLVRESSPIRTLDDVDREGVRVVAGAGSAYELYLSRHLRHAAVVKVPTVEEVVDAMLSDPATQVAAGVRQAVEADAKRVGGVRVLPGRFMAIHQAMAMPRGRSDDAKAALEAFIGECKASGFVAQALQRHGIEGATALR